MQRFRDIDCSDIWKKKQQKKGIGFILFLKVIPNGREWSPLE